MMFFHWPFITVMQKSALGKVNPIRSFLPKMNFSGCNPAYRLPYTLLVDLRKSQWLSAFQFGEAGSGLPFHHVFPPFPAASRSFPPLKAQESRWFLTKSAAILLQWEERHPCVAIKPHRSFSGIGYCSTHIRHKSIFCVLINRKSAFSRCMCTGDKSAG